MDGSVWSGQLIDANGRQASVAVRFIAEKNVATWKLSLVERDGVPTEIEGEAPFDRQNPRERMRLKTSEELPGGGRVDWELNLDPADAAMFAQQALVGAYSVRTEGTDVPVPLSRGVMVIWQFE